MIDVIIPAYNSHKTISQALFSLAYQSISDKLNVCIINDGSDKDYKEEIDFFKEFLKIREIKLEKNSGPGAARQFGIENTNSEYIVFLDSDDILFDSFSLSVLYNSINGTEYDMCVSNVIEETDAGFYLKEFNTIWLHGKIYRRKYIEDKKIKFDSIHLNEDDSFNQVLVLTDAKINYIEITTYIWKNNKESLTRKKMDCFDVKFYKDYIDAIDWAIEEAIKKNGNKEKIDELLHASIYYLYFMYNENYNEPKINEVLSYTKKLLNRFKQANISIERKMDLMQQQQEQTIGINRYVALFPNKTFEQYIELIEKMEDAND